MLRLTRAGEYAIRGMCYLAQQPTDKLTLIGDIAKEQGCSASFLAKIFQSLSKAGLIDSQRGVSGGVSLACVPEEINLKQIIEAYRGQSEAEAAFKDLKNPYHLAVRPVFHWTDQKLRVHAFCCVLGYLLARLTELLARRESGWRGSLPALLDQLARIRQVTVLEKPKGRGRPRVRTQLERLDSEQKSLARVFDITA